MTLSRTTTNRRARPHRLPGQTPDEWSDATAAEFDSVHTVERAKEVGSLTDILEPADLRPNLIAALEAASRPKG